MIMLLRPAWFMIPLVAAPYVPLGNVLSWLAIFALALLCLVSASVVHEPDAAWQRALRISLIVMTVAAAMWGPVGFALSGNFSGSFEPGPAFRGSPSAGV